MPLLPSGPAAATALPSLQQAAHQQCLHCHLDLANKGVQGARAPIPAAAATAPRPRPLVAKKNQEVVAKLPNKEIPRLQRGQPDATLVMYDPKNGRAASGKTVVDDAGAL